MRPDYHRATRYAYRTLLATGIDRLPVDVTAICGRCRNTHVLSFREARCLNDEFEPLWDGPSRTAFTLRRTTVNQTDYLILWNDEEMSRNSGLYRFSLAHELGHIVMKHGEDAGYIAELEANCFAQHLLCPRPVLEVLQPADYLEISDLCRVSRCAARVVKDSLQQENRYVDLDIWKRIFIAFNLDENRTSDAFLSVYQKWIRSKAQRVFR